MCCILFASKLALGVWTLHCTHVLVMKLRLREVTLAAGRRPLCLSSLNLFYVTTGQRAKTRVLLGQDCLSWKGAEILLLVRLYFRSFQMTKASLSCIPELLGICLLLSPRAHVLGRRLGQEQNTWPASEETLPGVAAL